MIFRSIIIALFLMPVSASADPPIPPEGRTEISSPAEAFDLATLMVNAFRKKKYGVATGLFLMLLVFGARRLKAFRNVPAEYTPWIAPALGILFSIGTVFAAGRPPVTAITHGFVLGAAAVGLWEMVGRYFLPPPPRG